MKPADLHAVIGPDFHRLFAGIPTGDPMDRTTQKRLKELLLYSPETGEFTWIVDRGGTARSGRIAGSINDRGYITVMIDGRSYKAHRLAFLWMEGRWPGPEVDHMDHDRSNNRWNNLRSGTTAFNQQNQVLAHRNNSVGLLGVHRVRNRFRAQIRLGGRRVCLGYYGSSEAAHEAYVEAKRSMHPGGLL